jgi:DNA-binding GntR family transcriptional regulator
LEFGVARLKVGLDSAEVAESTKADELALRLEEAIVSGELAPGTVLRQETLSERYEVSRTPVREALRRLAALGLVSFVPNRGVRVRTLSREELHEAFLVRAELESLATELATPRFTEEGLAELETASRRFTAATTALRNATKDGTVVTAQVREWASANHGFHDLIYAAAGSPLVERLAKDSRRTFFGQAIWAAGEEIDHLYVLNDQQHQAIRAAINARSPAGARVVAREHVLHSWRLLSTILDQVQARQGSGELRLA